MKKIKIGIIESGFGNIASVVNAIKYLNYNFEVIKRPKNLTSFSQIILPGVGSFNKAAKSLKQNGWFTAIKEFTEKGKPLFGICLGMQLMFEEGIEHGKAKGLGLFKGKCEKFKKNKKFPIPHVGFNIVKHQNTKIWKNIPNLSPFYFVHSYKISPKKNVKQSTTKHGEEFISFIERDNIYGAQFHPEKSHKIGLKLIRNFIEETY
ncbi:MAG: imidazole glycerol phosphate synthase subunit HisH [Pelagibacteraceae bacterium]|jgi:imidazole glycerol-phosphate synthase subunit HisH|nr:imidazole glycerol phosphate synthase subunit HisH [Pelagibacteraceae bacterium]